MLDFIRVSTFCQFGGFLVSHRFFSSISRPPVHSSVDQRCAEQDNGENVDYQEARATQYTAAIRYAKPQIMPAGLCIVVATRNRENNCVHGSRVCPVVNRRLRLNSTPEIEFRRPRCRCGISERGP